MLLLSPLVIILFYFLLPLIYFKKSFEKSEDEKKDFERIRFLKGHLLDQKNYTEAAIWFDQVYKTNYEKTKWWKLPNLFSIPPLARDWSRGYTPTVDQYVTDLCDPVYQRKIKNAIDREDEIAQLETVLSKTDKPDAILVGDEGVGKHTIVDAFAKKIYEGRSNSILIYKRILKLNLEAILTKSTDQKQRENILEELLKEALNAKNVILLIDDIDRYLSNDDKRVDLTLILEKFIKLPDIQIIGITTAYAYQKYIYSNEKMQHLFTKIDVAEVTQSQAVYILKNAALVLEQRYKISIPYETVLQTIEKSNFFLTSIPFPEKAIELLDMACANLIKSKKELLTPDIIDAVLTQITHTPTTLNDQMKDKLIHLENLLLSQIVSQDEGVEQVASAMRRAFILLGKRKKPLASFLFLGPTGVGKTETAKVLARIFFGTSDKLIRFDMSLYQSADDIPKLIGSIEGTNPGLLSSAIREHPYGVLLLDELEKANHDLLNIFLTVLDEGYFTDGYGKKVDCKNLVIIATSNAGSELLYQLMTGDASGRAPDSAQRSEHWREGNSGQDPSYLVNYLVEKKIFLPEFLNRFDGVIQYNPLDQQAIVQIARKMVDQISKDILKLHEVHLQVSDEYLTQLVQKSYDPKFGARNMERIIRDEIEDKAAKMILEDKINGVQEIKL